jgi:uncharacterized phage protein (TIGR01671 family)
MREIKFRYYDSTIKQFIYSDEFSYPGICERLEMFFGKARNYSEDVIQQYTGLKDKSGKEIYEGDIVQYNRRSSYDGINFEVKWSEDNWGWVLVSKNKDYLINEQTPEGYRYEFIEIVGNIFENPDLLKQYARN